MTRKDSHHNTMVKLLTVQDKKKFKLFREKHQVPFEGTLTKLTEDFSTEPVRARSVRKMHFKSEGK
jgi:hypothetical protein